MTAIISMLRGVNVGGHHRMKMEELRGLYESLGLRDPQTCLQSGNVIFRTRERNLVPLARRIEGAIEQRFGFRTEVFLRTAAELRDVIAGNPFARRDGINPSKLLVIFLDGDPGPETRGAVLRIKADPEEVRMTGRELYIYFPNGVGKSKLLPALGKALKKSWTGRNWNTVTKLIEIAVNM